MANLIRSSSNDMRSLQREIDRMFDGFFPARRSGSEEETSAVWAPRVDLSETDDAYHIYLDVPGMTKENLNINFHDDQLSVSGERKREETDEQRDYVRVERSYGNFYRSFRLPKRVDADQIEAGYEDGVLSVHVPKSQESKPRRIEVA